MTNKNQKPIKITMPYQLFIFYLALAFVIGMLFVALLPNLSSHNNSANAVKFINTTGYPIQYIMSIDAYNFSTIGIINSDTISLNYKNFEFFSSGFNCSNKVIQTKYNNSNSTTNSSNFIGVLDYNQALEVANSYNSQFGSPDIKLCDVNIFN